MIKKWKLNFGKCPDGTNATIEFASEPPNLFHRFMWWLLLGVTVITIVQITPQEKKDE